MGFKQEVDREKLFNLASERSDRKVGSWNDFEELPTRNKQDLLENSETDVLFESDQKSFRRPDNFGYIRQNGCSNEN